MNKQKRLPVKKIVLAMALAGYAYGAAWAGTTGTSATIKGNDPSTLVAPASGVLGVDFSFDSQATANVITAGDVIRVKYNHGDTDGDLDATSVDWMWFDSAGAQLGAATTTGTPVPGEEYAFTVAAPPAGADHIGVVVTGKSASGDPLTPITLTIPNIGLAAGNGGGIVLPGVGGNGPIIRGAQAGGIFLVSANATAGSGAVDYGDPATNPTAVPKVGEAFELKVWDDVNGNGAWDAGETDLTGTPAVTLASVTWTLGGTAASADALGVGGAAAAAAATGALTYTIPVNGGSNSGQAWGDQGYTLQVSW